MITSEQVPSPPGPVPVASLSRMTWARRVTVVTPQARVDAALPVQSTIAELLPQLLRLSDAGQHLSRYEGGWVLTRLGGAPLSPGLTVTAAGLRDGDVLYLKPRERPGPPMLFDDVVDAIASATQSWSGSWQPRMARLAGIAAGAAALLGATLLLSAYLSGRLAAPVGAAVAALVLLASGAALSRAGADADAGAACASVGAAAAAIAGMAALAPHHAWSPGARSLALGLAAAAGYGVLAVMLVARWPSWFGCLTLAAALGAATAAVPALTAVKPAGAAAVLAVVATALTPAAPMVAMRLTRLPLPEVPSDIAAFRTAEAPTLGPDVLGQTAAAQRLLTGLLCGLGLSVAGAVVILLRGDRPEQALLAGLLGLVWLLRSRSYAGAPQRGVALAAGLLSLAWLAGWLAAGHYRTALAAGAAVLAVAGLACVVHARRAARGRRSPQASRLLDVAEFLAVVSLLPVAGLVLDVFQHVRNAVH